MKLPIYLYGHPVLREVGQDITNDYPNLNQLIADMWETMYHSDGIGIAAPQIGLAIRLFVIDAQPMAEYYPECRDFKQTFINAHIVECSDVDDVKEEGCLSIPNVHELVKRPTTITIEFLDEHFTPRRETYTGFAARVVQHEYDHIEGKLFIDYISTIRKQMIRSKLLNIVGGKVRTHYRVVSAPSKRKS